MGYIDNAQISEVEAINTMLMACNFPRINSIDTSIPYVYEAVNILNRVSREVQATGLNCNTDYKYTLVPNIDKEINIPSNTLKIDTTRSYCPVATRGTRLYNKKDHNYEFDSEIEVDIVFMIPFEELPQVVRHYIMIRATRKYQTNVLGSEAMYRFTREDEIEAERLMRMHELENEDNNIFDNYDTFSVISRDINTRW